MLGAPRSTLSFDFIKRGRGRPLAVGMAAAACPRETGMGRWRHSGRARPGAVEAMPVNPCTQTAHISFPSKADEKTQEAGGGQGPGGRLLLCKAMVNLLTRRGSGLPLVELSVSAGAVKLVLWPAHRRGNCRGSPVEEGNGTVRGEALTGVAPGESVVTNGTASG